MIPVVAPPLDEQPLRMRRFRASQPTENDAVPPGDLTQPPEEPSGDQSGGDRRSRWLARHRPHRRWSSRTTAPTVMMALSAAAILAAAIIRRTNDRHRVD
jgi:hypothetical protein